MRFIDYGLGVWDHRAFEVVPETGSFDLAAVSQEMLGRGELAGFEVTERFYEIGSVEGLAETQEHLAGWHGSKSPEPGRSRCRTRAIPIGGQAGHRRPEHRGDRTHGRSAGADPATRRTAVHPGGRRQRRQRLARRQRLPQDRRHRGLRPDRQRLGADGADQ